MITDYDSLLAAITGWLNRSDLTEAVKTFVQLAERRFRRDERCRKLQDRGTFSISANGDALPSDFQALQSWYHDGGTYFGPIEIVGADQLGTLKGLHGATGVPRYAAVVDGTVRYAPAPDGTYSTKMLYWRKIEALSASNPTNWLLDEHPDLYLYGALAHSGSYLKDAPAGDVDPRAELDAILNELGRATWNQQYGGGTMRRQFSPIGG